MSLTLYQMDLKQILCDTMDRCYCYCNWLSDLSLPNVLPTFSNEHEDHIPFMWLSDFYFSRHSASMCQIWLMFVNTNSHACKQLICNKTYKTKIGESNFNSFMLLFGFLCVALFTLNLNRKLKCTSSQDLWSCDIEYRW